MKSLRRFKNSRAVICLTLFCAAAQPWTYASVEGPLNAKGRSLNTSGGQTFTSFGGSMTDISETARLYDAGIWHHRPEIIQTLLPRVREIGGGMRLVLMYRDQFIVLEDEESRENNESVGGFNTAPESWFLHDGKGKRVPVPDYHEDYYGEKGQRRWFMDPGNADFRSYWIDKTLKHVDEGNWDGVFVDDVLLTLTAHRLEPGQIATYKDDASFQQAVLGFLREITRRTREIYGRGEGRKIIIPNISLSYDYDPAVLRDFLNAADGYMEEHHVTAWAWGEHAARRQMEALRQARHLGKHVFLLTYADPSSGVPNLLETSLSAYLVALAGYPNAYWSFRSDEYAPFNERPAFEFWAGRGLGQPRPEIEFYNAEGVRLDSSQESVIWLRRFDNGIAVVNLTAARQSLTINGESLQLKPFQGKLKAASV
ncbi:MAG: putative glycoside hydrolase [Candidatus Omnitrophota bacterium]|nr:putative glycoside hydrolase [Candidatus Omnitrophota bacterium]